MESSLQDPLIGRQVDDYLIEELLGHGGMARVYRAHDVKLQRYVALKVLIPLAGYVQQSHERFEREARAIARLNYPNIVAIHRFNAADDVYYIAMEYVDGADLRWIIDDYNVNGQLMDYETVLGIMTQIAYALDYAHDHGVIHRDIKPSNIMINREGNAILTDFNLALLSSEESVGEVFGTAHYVAPEQASSSMTAVPQSDFYSLGVVLYELLTGRVPFTGDDIIFVATAHVNELPPDPRKFVPDLHPNFVDILSKMLSKSPDDRFQNGLEIIEALQLAIAASEGKHPAKISIRGPRTRITAHKSPLLPPESLRQVVDQTRNVFSSLKSPVFAISVGVLVIVLAVAAFIFLSSGKVETGTDLDIVMPEERFLNGADISIPPIRELAPSNEELVTIVWSPDGRYLAGAGNGGMAVIWDMEDGHIVHHWQAHTASINALAWDLTGEILVTGGDDTTLNVWRVSDTVEQIQSVVDLNDDVTAISWSPDNATVIASTRPGSILRWDATNDWQLMRTLFTNPVVALDWNGDGTAFASGSSDLAVRVWDVVAGNSELVGSHHAAIVALDWDAMSQRIAVISEDGDARLWDTANSSYFRLAWELENATDILFSRDATKIVAAHGTEVTVWDAETGSRIAILSVENNQLIRSLAWHPDSSQLAGVTETGIVRLWTVPSDIPARLVADANFIAHEGSVTDIIWDENGERFASVGDDGVLRFWSTTSREKLVEFASLHDGTITALAWGHNPDLVVTGGCDGNISMINLVNQQVEQTLTGHEDCVIGIAFSTNKQLWSVDTTGRILIRDLETFDIVLDLDNIHAAPVTDLFGIDPTHFVTLGQGGDLRVWEFEEQQLDNIISHNLPNSAISTAIWNPATEVIMTGNAAGKVRVWGDPLVASSSVEFSQLQSGIAGLTMSRGGEYLVGVDDDGCMTLWLTDSAEKLSVQCDPLPGAIVSYAWNPATNILATGTEQGNITIWKIP